MVLVALLNYDVDSLDPSIPRILQSGTKGADLSWDYMVSNVCSCCYLSEPSPKKIRVSSMRHQVLYVSLTFLCLSLIHAHPFQVGSTVQTSSGAIIGHAAQNRKRVSEYLGIPYAKPPLGDLRFAAPQTYSSAQTYNASTFVSSCYPYGRY